MLWNEMQKQLELGELTFLKETLFIHSFIVSVRNHPKMDLDEPQAVRLQARFTRRCRAGHS